MKFTSFDHVFSNTIMLRTPFKGKELIWGAKFKSMYNKSQDHSLTPILKLNKLNTFDGGILTVSVAIKNKKT